MACLHSVDILHLDIKTGEHFSVATIHSQCIRLSGCWSISYKKDNWVVKFNPSPSAATITSNRSRYAVYSHLCLCLIDFGKAKDVKWDSENGLTNAILQETLSLSPNKINSDSNNVSGSSNRCISFTGISGANRFSTKLITPKNASDSFAYSYQVSKHFYLFYLLLFFWFLFL